MTDPADTCDDCPACRDESTWTECCAACHCAPAAIRCANCRFDTDPACPHGRAKKLGLTDTPEENEK